MKKLFITGFAATFLLSTVVGAIGQTTTTPKTTKSKNTTTKPSKMASKEITTPSGLKYVDHVVGKGASPVKGKNVSVFYTGKFTDGTPFDSNIDPKFGKHDPLVFPIGMQRVIAGWEEGIMSMKVGGKRTLTVPPKLGYGSQGMGGVIPPNATLIFDVELVKADQ